MKASNYSIGLVRNSPVRRLYVTASPFDWLDATIFYVDIANKPYIFWNTGEENPNQSYKDKGFNIKASFDLFDDHKIAFGLNDFAGTGYFNSEYIIISGVQNKFEYSFGLGWGEFSSGIKIDNPLISLSERFENRSNEVKSYGGTIDFNNFFSGEDASFFGGLSYHINENSKFIAEYDPTSLDSKIKYPDSNFKINLGYEFKFGNHTTLKAGLLRGNKLFAALAYNADLSKYDPNPKYVPKKEIRNYDEIRQALVSNQIGLISIAENDEDIKISVKQNAYSNQYLPNEVIRHVISEYKPNSNIYISQSSLGMEMVQTAYKKGRKVNVRNEEYQDIELKDTYSREENFPIVRTNFSTEIRNFIAARESFYFGGLILENNTQIYFSESTYIDSNLKYSLYDNFDELFIPPLDTYPNQVRSDLKKYMNNFGNGVIIGRLQISHLFSHERKHFFRFTGGIYEEMFGGIGAEYLYYPEGSIISLGAEIFHVKKRSYDMKFNFMDYSNNISRINFSILEPQTNVITKLSFGEYLAGDIGYTLEFKRRFDNGVEMSAFFSRTDVSEELFGEGSFDKGVKLKIPFDLFNLSSKTPASSFTWRPLTKDPAALLIKSIELEDEVRRFRIY